MRNIINTALISALLLSGCGAPQETITPVNTQQLVNAQNIKNPNDEFTIRELNNRLRSFESRYVNMLNSYEREQARKEMNYIYYLLSQLSNGSQMNPPMSEADFMNFYSRVKAQSFPDDKKNMIKTGSKSSWFTVNQISQLITIFTFDDDRLEILSIVYAKATDKQNGYQLIDLFKFNKDNARKIIESYAKTDGNNSTTDNTTNTNVPPQTITASSAKK